jgi:hypothetical protein
LGETAAAGLDYLSLGYDTYRAALVELPERHVV